MLIFFRINVLLIVDGLQRFILIYLWYFKQKPILISVYTWVCCFNSFLFFYLVDTISQKLKNNNVFTIAKRNVEGQDMLYQSLKLTNGIWVLAELKIQPNNPNFMVSEHRQMQPQLLENVQRIQLSLCVV